MKTWKHILAWFSIAIGILALVSLLSVWDNYTLIGALLFFFIGLCYLEEVRHNEKALK